MKKLALVLLAVFLVCGMAFAGPGGQKGGVVKIGVAVPTADHGWTGGIGWWADYKVKEIQNQYAGQVEFRVVHSANATQQVSDVENLSTWGMNYLVILPHESAPLTAPVKALAKKGLKVIVVDRGLTDTDFGYVNLAGDNSGLGRFSGQWMAATMKNEKLTNYVVMGGMPVVIDTERMNAFFAEMDKESSLVDLQGKDKYEFANWSVQDGQRLMETFLTQYPGKIHAVFCQDDDVLTGVISAIKQNPQASGSIKIAMGGAGSKVVYQMIMNNDPLVRATTLYHPSMIAEGIQYAVDVATGKKPDDFSKASKPLTVVIPSALIDKSNVAQYYNADSSY
jgi:ribose transport system substrate-binding protein